MVPKSETTKVSMNEAKQDILTRNEVITMVDHFYAKVKEDKLLRAVFAHVDWAHHLPIMYNFWSSILFGDQRYRGNPLQRHLHLAIDQRHFQQWLILFYETIDENFTGEKAEEVKMRARAIAGVFQVKMGLIQVPGRDPAPLPSSD